MKKDSYKNNSSSAQLKSKDSGWDDVHVSRKKKKKKWLVALFIVLTVLVVLLAAGVLLFNQVNKTKNLAYNLKDEMKSVLEYAKDKDAENASAALQQSYETAAALEENINSPFWTYARKIDRVDKEITAGTELLTWLGEVQDELLTPLIALMKEQPLTNLKVGEDGFNVTLINRYLDFAEEIMPKLEEIISKIDQIDTGSMMGSYVGTYKDKITTYMNAYNEASALLPLLRTFLGSGEDRLYLLVAQNSAEIRASGGFPGSIGTIRIQDGVLTIGDFNSVYDVLSGSVSFASEVSEDEFGLFGAWVNAPRDACFIPAFERTAKIWAVAYEDMQRENGAYDILSHFENVNLNPEPTAAYDSYLDPYTGIETPIYYGYDYTRNAPRQDYSYYYAYNDDPQAAHVDYVDGVVSLTPAIIQMLLKDVGAITLSDGTELDGTNATRILQYVLYHRYFESDTLTWDSNDISDALFAETAKMAMSKFVSSFEISKFADYYKLFKEGAEKRIINMWMADPDEEDTIFNAGISGSLNSNPNEPVAGVYFSLADACKLGWYLDIFTNIDEPVINEDGSRSYHVTVKLDNTIPQRDIDNSHEYIIGTYNGAIRGYIHCFAPAGAVITDVETENLYYMLNGTYQNLNLIYNLDLLLEPDNPITISYTITTAPGVETPLQIVTTPTLSEYR